MRRRSGHGGVPQLEGEHECFARAADFPEEANHIGHCQVEPSPVAVLGLATSEVKREQPRRERTHDGTDQRTDEGC